MELSKVALSDAEWQMAAVPDFILTKNRVIEGVYEIFGELADEYRNNFDSVALKNPALAVWSPKISRGEKYEDMPWVMLDYPRCFSETEGHFAIRSFFWWGNFFSIQWHLSGKYLHQFAPLLPTLARMGWLTGFSTDPWNHRIPNENWSEVVLENLPAKPGVFGKAVKKMPIQEWASVKRFYLENYQELAAVISKGA